MTGSVGLRVACLAAAVALGAGVAAAKPLAKELRAEASALPRLAHHRQWFTDPEGRVVMIHGGNVTLPELDGSGALKGGQRWSADTPRRMAEQGFNGVRLVVFFDKIMPRPGQVDPAYLERIAKTVEAYRAAGVYTLIDFHQDQYGPKVGVRGLPDWATFSDGHERIPGMQFPMGYFKDPAVQRAFDNFWSNRPVPGAGRGVQDLYVEGLAAVARRFANEPAAFGIDVMNEPSPGTPCSQPDPVQAHCPELERSLLGPFYDKAGKAISAVARDTMVFVEPFMLQGALGLPINTPMPGLVGRQGLSFHNYGPSKATRDLTNDAALQHVVRSNAAIINTEWGFTNDAAEIDGQAQDFDDRMISWLAWTRGAFEAVVDPALPDRGNGNRTALLRAYARPYPSATAGTPERLTFDPAAGVLQYRYATSSPSGRRLSGSAATEIRIPAVNYPHGYAVHVTGGRVISGANAAVLRVRNDPKAANVEIKVVRTGELPPLPPTSPEAEFRASAAPLPPIPAGPLSRDSLIGHILATPGGREVLQKHAAEVMTGLSHVHGSERMTLAGVKEFAPSVLTEPLLTAIDRDLAMLKPTPGPVVGRLSSRSLVSDLLRDAKARAILAREAPGLETSPNQGLFPQTTLRGMQPVMPDLLREEVLNRIDAALAAN
jgi:endoglycosylceramidase